MLANGNIASTVDKSSSAELTESINSMFQWYRQAVVCYAYLEDYPMDMPPESGLPGCRWFTRGWTLQELLAPERVKFYSQNWTYLGPKHDHSHALAWSFLIPVNVLLNVTEVFRSSIANRMSWASKRRTKRKEDLAYCLLGLFEVNMPLIYGEGAKAFLRLQEEIIKRSSDLSIFAWNPISGVQARGGDWIGVFATSPAEFAASWCIDRNTSSHAEFSLTNRGLLLTGGFPLLELSPQEKSSIPRSYFLIVGILARILDTDHQYTHRGIFLQKYGPSRYRRMNGLPLADFKYGKVWQYTSQHETTGFCWGEDVNTRALETAVYISTDDAHTYSFELSNEFRAGSVHIPEQKDLKLVSVAPLPLWDHVNAVFFEPNVDHTDRGYYPMVLAAEFVLSPYPGGDQKIVVVFKMDRAGNDLLVFPSKDYYPERSLLFEAKASNEGISWEELMRQAPRLLKNLGSSTEMKIRGESAARPHHPPMQTFNIAFWLRVDHLRNPHGNAVSDLVSSVTLIESRPVDTGLIDFNKTSADVPKISVYVDPHNILPTSTLSARV